MLLVAGGGVYDHIQVFNLPTLVFLVKDTVSYRRLSNKSLRLTLTIWKSEIIKIRSYHCAVWEANVRKINTIL